MLATNPVPGSCHSWHVLIEEGGVGRSGTLNADCSGGEQPDTDALLGLAGDDDGLQQLVGDGLALDVPQREEPTDVADDAVDDVGDGAHDTHAAADDLARLLAHAAEAGDGHPRALALGADQEAEVEPRHAEGDVHEEGEQCAEGAGDGAEDGDDDEADDADHDDDGPVDDDADGPLTPVGQRSGSARGRRPTGWNRPTLSRPAQAGTTCRRRPATNLVPVTCRSFVAPYLARVVAPRLPGRSPHVHRRRLRPAARQRSRGNRSTAGTPVGLPTHARSSQRRRGRSLQSTHRIGPPTRHPPVSGRDPPHPLPQHLRLSMLRNLKVGTKLLVILAAPMAVVLILVAVGARQRQDVADGAQRVEQLAQFASVTSNLSGELRAEAVQSVLTPGTEAGGEPSATLAAQRARTDAATAQYLAVRQGITAAPESTLGLALSSSDPFVASISTSRSAVDNGVVSPYSMVGLYDPVINSLGASNAALTQETNDAALLKSLNTALLAERVAAAQGSQGALMTSAAVNGSFIDSSGKPCLTLNSSCQSWQRTQDAGSALTQAQLALDQSGSAIEDKTAVQTAEGLVAYNDLVSTTLTAAQAPNPLTGLVSNEVAVGGEEMAAATLTAQASLGAVDRSMLDGIVTTARSLGDSASRAVTLYLLGGIAGLVIALAIAVLVSRSITRPLTRLTRAAATLSEEQLPALVEQLRNPEEGDADAVAEALAPISIDSRDEIGELADAFNSIQAVTVDVAEEQGRLLRKGIGDIFVNLARRNQSLLDRQIEFIDQLETNERDPDQLENLFRLDHLATRMRRNAESLLVMAGADPPRRRGKPVPVADVVRVAIGEVEDYQRVHLIALDDATVTTNVASDLAHLLSELMENSTNASPPQTSVEVLGRQDDRNGYVVSIADRGIGMADEQLTEANHTLSHPPMVGLAITRSLGLTVVSRLAARYGIAVELETRPDGGGVVATVNLPYSVVEYPGDESEPNPTAAEVMEAVEARPKRGRRASRPAAAAVSAGTTSAPETESTPATDHTPGPAPTPEREAPVVSEPSEPPPTPTSAGLPRRRGAPDQPSGSSPIEPGLSPAPVVSVSSPSTTDAASPATSSSEPGPASAVATAPLTAAGLVRRTPRTAAPTAAAATAPSRPVTRTNRSPEEVRRMLSRYRSGLDRGRIGSPDDDPTSSSDDASEPSTPGAED